MTAITVPPLRERVEDIEPVVHHFNRLLSTRHQVPMRQFAPGVIETLRSKSWPGNVRELRNLVERPLLTSHGVVTHDDLPPGLTHVASPAATSHPPQAAPPRLNEMEHDAILRALQHEHGNLAAAARRLGVSRSTIYRKISRYEAQVAADVRASEKMMEFRFLPAIPATDESGP